GRAVLDAGKREDQGAQLVMGHGATLIPPQAKKKAAPPSERGLDLVRVETTYSMSSFSRPTLKKPFFCISFMTSMNCEYFTSGWARTKTRSSVQPRPVGLPTAVQTSADRVSMVVCLSARNSEPESWIVM